MLVSEIATRVKRQFSDEAGLQITDPDIIRWVNDAQREIAIKNNLLQVRATAAGVVGTSEYAVPTNILTLHSVRYQGRKLTALSQQESDQLIEDIDDVTNGTPTHFWQFAGNIVLYPKPEVAGAADIQMYYTRTPVDVTVVGNTPELPIQYHNRIVEYCIAQAAELDDNLAAYQLKMGQFEAGINQLKGIGEQNENDFYPSITTSPNDYGYWDSEFYA